MSNRKQRIKNRNTYNALMSQLEAQGKLNRPPCSSCGKSGSHFVMPCFGQEGYFACYTQETAKEASVKKLYCNTPEPPPDTELEGEIEEIMREVFSEKDNDSM